MSKIDDIEARWKAATPGPWTAKQWRDGASRLSWGVAGPPDPRPLHDETVCDWAREHDAAAIAAAPDDIAWLLRVARAAAEVVADYYADAAPGELGEWPAVDRMRAALSEPTDGDSADAG